MKTVKLLLSIAVVLAFFGFNEVQAQWATSGTNIYNTNTDNVGIGTTTPGFKLDVVRFGNPQVRVMNNGGAAGATFRMVDMLSGADFAFKSTSTGGFKIRDMVAGLDVFFIEANSAANMLYITTSDRLGIGTSTPAQFVDIRGDVEMYTSYPFITLNNTSTTGNAGLVFESNGAYRGWLYYNDASDHLLINAESGNGFRTDLIIKSDGSVCLGTAVPAVGYRLSVNGKVACEEVLVELDANWPDYVFTEEYNLMTLSELENSIKQNNHLPGMPSAAEIESNGLELGQMQTILVEKVEELTLYTIEQGKQIEALQQQIEQLEKNQKAKAKRQR